MNSVIDLIHQEDKTAFSFEVLPPLKGNGTDQLFRNIDKLMEFDPQYINITTHRSEFVYREDADGRFIRERQRKRPGTVAVAAAIHNRYGIKVVPHMVCSGFSRESIEYMLLDLQFLGVNDLLVLRGDKAKDDRVFTPEPNGPSHAIDLQDQINDFNAGRFIDGSTIKVPGQFSYGVACYPEKHEESPNAEQDLYWLKKKVEAGAQYAVTQMFFDNRKYFDFVERARKAGINVPIIPGIKPFAKLSQLSVVPKTFHLDLPQELTTEALKCKNDEDAKALGIEWCAAQCQELIAHGVPSIHFYTIGAVDSIARVAQRIY
ncbi:MAG: methylenetetrahydrofolate reductase [NAD(P)H] [Bacteroidaceae bacterium]|nr:methylenetetrahydrofolate reductase [NAD(P)H] [Bacteroidaceae bacterium]